MDLCLNIPIYIVKHFVFKVMLCHDCHEVLYISIYSHLDLITYFLKINDCCWSTYA